MFFLSFALFISLFGSIGVSEAHILVIGNSLSDFPISYQETSQLADDLRERGYSVLDYYGGDATTENILKGMYGADAVIYDGHGGYQSGNYNGVGGTANPPFALIGSDDFIWGIGGQMREGWYGDLFTAPFRPGIPVFLLHTCFSTGWVESYQVANPIETIYNFAQMFNGADANYYATAWNNAEIIYDFLNGASNFQDANNQNTEKIVTSTLYNGVKIWRNNNGYAAFVGDWNGVFPSASETRAYDEAAADAWYHSDRQIITRLYADANNGNDSWDGTSPIFLGGTTGPMKTITSTINTLNPWGTIIVASGTYIENLVINKEINLIGSGVNTKITPLNAQNPIINITSGGNGSLISGFILNGASTSSAVAISGASSCTVANNNITGSQVGVLIAGNNNIVYSNQISGSRDGVYIDKETEDNIVFGNQINSSSSSGVYCEGGNNHYINNNTITQGSSGITVNNSKDVKVGSNRVTSNTKTGVTIKNSNNTIVSDNNISNNQNGIEISDNSQDNTVSDNTINENQNNGISIDNSQNNHINHNTVQNNVQNGINLNNSSGNIIKNGNNIRGSEVGINLENNSNSNTINGNIIQGTRASINITGSNGNVISDNEVTFTINEILTAANVVKNSIESSKVLPTSVLIGFVPVNMAQFLHLAVQATIQLNNNENTLILMKNDGVPGFSEESLKSGSLSLAGFVDFARRIDGYMDDNREAPPYGFIGLGKMGYESQVYLFSRILSAYNSNGNLPANIMVEPWAQVINPEVSDPTAMPISITKLVFIHHSCGGNWLATGNGNLGTTLNNNNYYVSETNYGWDAEPGDNLGDRTDTDDWPEWFTDQKMPYIYNNDYHSAYTNTISNPGGENEIIMFKSCYPLSEVGTSIDDEKAIYNSLKAYFAAHPDKLFVLITPPGEATVTSYQLTRELCDWLVDKDNGWLAGYTGKNVFVFDFYGVLSETNSHHRWNNGQIEHVYASDYDGVSPYHNGDDHPNVTGNQKATNEFVTLLNYAYNQWKN